MYADYLYFRHANNSFMAAAILICLLRTLLPPLKSASNDRQQGPRRVLDLSCGISHSSYLISTLFPSFQVIGVDWDFANLRLAKRYLCQTGTFICLDAELPLPFSDQSFAACLALDGLHYIRSKVALLSELDRVLDPQALWLFPHLHNALQPNPAPGVPVAPEEWARLLSFLPHRILFLGRHNRDVRPARRDRPAHSAPAWGSSRRTGAGGRGNAPGRLMAVARRLFVDLVSAGSGSDMEPDFRGHFRRRKCPFAFTLAERGHARGVPGRGRDPPGTDRLP
jgi:SAM-dependent methyltransferase